MESMVVSTGEQTPRSRSSSSSSSRRRMSHDEPQEQEKVDGEHTNLFDNVLAQERFLKEIKCKKSWWTLVIHLRESDSALADSSEDVATLYGDIGYLQMHCDYIRNAVKWEDSKRQLSDVGEVKESVLGVADVYQITIPAEQFTEYELAYLIGHLYRPDLFEINIEMAPRLAELADYLGAECIVRTCRSTLEDAIHKTIRKFKEPCASCQRRIRRMEDLSLLAGRPSQRTFSIASTRRPVISQSVSNFIGCSCIESSLNEMSSKQKENLEFLSAQLVTSINYNLVELKDVLVAFFLERRPRIEFLVTTKAFADIPDNFKVQLLLRAFKSNMF